jgi:hypothetical protein
MASGNFCAALIHIVSILTIAIAAHLHAQIYHTDAIGALL